MTIVNTLEAREQFVRDGGTMTFNGETLEFRANDKRFYINGKRVNVSNARDFISAYVFEVAQLEAEALEAANEAGANAVSDESDEPVGSDTIEYNGEPLNEHDYMSIKEAAEYLGVSKVRVHRYIEHGRLVYSKRAHVWRVSIVALRAEREAKARAKNKAGS